MPVYDLIIGISTLLATLIPFIGQVIDSSRPGIIKKVTLTGWIFICVSITGITANILKEQNSSDAQNLKDAKQTRDLWIGDSLHQVKFRLKDSMDKAHLAKRDEEHQLKEGELQKYYTAQLTENSRKNLGTYTGALAKYNLQYLEGQNKVVLMLRDSSNKPLNIPFIDICKYPTCSVEPITFEGGKDSLLMHLKYANTGAPATHININIIMCFRANNQLFLIEGHRLNISDKQLNTGEFTTINANTITTNGEIIEKIYICISGTCRNSDGKEFPIFLLNEYDFKEKKYIGGLLSDDYKEVASFLKNNQKL